MNLHRHIMMLTSPTNLHVLEDDACTADMSVPGNVHLQASILNDPQVMWLSTWTSGF
jgi:hypothetical protein